MTAIPIAVPGMRATAQVKKILYATDFSEASRRALPLVVAIAKKYRSAIYIENVWFPLPYSMSSPDVPGAFEAEQFEDALARTRKVLNLIHLVIQIMGERSGR